MVKGTVSITLEDYHALIETATKFKEKEGNLGKASKELQVFLSYLCTRIDIEPFVKEFNKQSRTAEIILEGGYAKIKFKD